MLDKVLSGNERVEEVSTVFSLEGNDLAACAAHVGVDVECLPEMVYGRGTWHGTDVMEDADIGLEYRPKRIEKPAMRRR